MNLIEKMRSSSVLPAALSMLIWIAFPNSGHADVKIILSPDVPDGVQLEAIDATVEELLSTLRAKFGLTFRSEKQLTHRVDGVYAGTLRSIMRQILTNYDHVLRSENGEFALFVFDQQKPYVSTSL